MKAQRALLLALFGALLAGVCAGPIKPVERPSAKAESDYVFVKLLFEGEWRCLGVSPLVHQQQQHCPHEAALHCQQVAVASSGARCIFQDINSISSTRMVKTAAATPPTTCTWPAVVSICVAQGMTSPTLTGGMPTPQQQLWPRLLASQSTT